MEFVSAPGMTPALEIGQTRHDSRTPVGSIEGNNVGTMLDIVVGNDVGDLDGLLGVGKFVGEVLGIADGPIKALVVGVPLGGWVGNDVSIELGILVGTAEGVAAPLPTYEHNEIIEQTAFITARKGFFEAVETMRAQSLLQVNKYIGYAYVRH